MAPCQVFWWLLCKVHDARLWHLVVILLICDYAFGYRLLCLALQSITLASDLVLLLPIDLGYRRFRSRWNRWFSIRPWWHPVMVVDRNQLDIVIVCLTDGGNLSRHTIEVLNWVLREGPLEIFIHVTLWGHDLLVDPLTHGGRLLLLLFSGIRCGPRRETGDMFVVMTWPVLFDVTGHLLIGDSASCMVNALFAWWG